MVMYWFQNCWGSALLCKREGCDWVFEYF